MIKDEIKSLVAQALQDGVLTFRERQVIMEKATDCDPEELKAYIDEALKNKMSFIPKESLKRCPKCGSQVPLLSDECPFCGFHYAENADTAGNMEIEAENYNTDSAYVKDYAPIEYCPDWSAPLPK